MIREIPEARPYRLALSLCGLVAIADLQPLASQVTS
ncbi:hypothetical protein DC74_2960 [Streptomyces noursei]|nr:hypothetical protein DC74_2960 [Streptomyces noursei]